MKSKSFQVNTIQELEKEIINSKSSNFHPSLAILFGSIDCNLGLLPDLFNRYEIDLVGCSSAGEISEENFYEKGISGLFLDINSKFYQISLDQSVKGKCYEVGIGLGQRGSNFCDTPSYLTFFGMTACAESLIKGIQEAVKKEVLIFGGMAGDDFRMEESFIFTNSGVFSDASVTLIFDQNKVELKGKAVCGWEPIGAMNTITHAEGNIIYQINDKPALQAFEDYFGSFYDNQEEEDTLAIGVAQYPMQIVRGNDTVLRAALKIIEEDLSIMVAGPVKTGDRFKFSVAPGFEIIEETIQEFKDYHFSQPVADAMILVSCIARRMSLGPMVEEEIKGIQNLWKKPMIGFFSYGEVGINDFGDCNFYNETCSLVLINEK